MIHYTNKVFKNLINIGHPVSNNNRESLLSFRDYENFTMGVLAHLGLHDEPLFNLSKYIWKK